MPRLPKVSGTEMIKILERHDYRNIRTKGSHVRLYPPENSSGLKKVTVPLHTEIKPGTPSGILKGAGL